MKKCIISNEEKFENSMLQKFSKDSIAKYSDNMWSVEKEVTVEELFERLEKQENVDVAYVDVTRRRAISAAKELRKENEKAAMMLIADEQMSPMEYVQPNIQATSLLVRPFSSEKAREVVEKTIYWYQQQHKEGEACYEFECEDTVVSIEYNKILYIESNNKKIYIHTLEDCFAIYGTLEEISSLLPDQFVRCHRSYIINWLHHLSVDMTRGEILLAHQVCVPMSRTYKAKIKDLKKRRKG